MQIVIFGRVLSLSLTLHSVFVELAGVRQINPLRWPDVLLQHHADEVDRQVKPTLKGTWLKAERVRILQDIIAEVSSWTYERGFGRRDAKILIEWLYENRGIGPRAKKVQRQPCLAVESQEVLGPMKDKRLQETWDALCMMRPMDIALQASPYDDCPSMADWMEQVFFEICFRQQTQEKAFNLSVDQGAIAAQATSASTG